MKKRNIGIRIFFSFHNNQIFLLIIKINRKPLSFFGGVHLTQQRVREWYFIIIVLIKRKNFYKSKAGTVSFLNNIRSQHSCTIHWWVEWCDVIQISQQIKMQARAITNEPTASVFSSISHHSRTICWWVEWGGSIHYSVKVIDDARTFKFNIEARTICWWVASILIVKSRFHPVTGGPYHLLMSRQHLEGC